MNSFVMAFKSLLYRRKQYLSLFLVCFFGVGISLFCLFLMDGMLNALEYKAKIYYGGDLQFIGGRNSLDISDPKQFKESLKEVFPENVIISERYDLDADYAAFYFEGTGVRQRVIKGINFDTEKTLFSSWNFTEGNAEIETGSNKILISEPIAQMLEIHAGDSLTFLYRRNSGQINTKELVVQGIFRDSSLFGMYTSYMDFEVLEKVAGYPLGWCNRIVIFFPDGSPSEKEILSYQQELEQKFTMFPLTDNKQKFYDKLLSWSFDKPTYALIKLSANLQDVQILIDAMKLIATFIIVMLVIIITAGVSSTFRVIVMKRVNEIGIYKAIGMKRFKIAGNLLAETSLLLITGCLSGFVLSLGLCSISRLINLSFIPAFDIFLTNGVLVAKISLKYYLIISAVVFVTTTAAVLFAIRKSVRISPCQALAVTE